MSCCSNLACGNYLQETAMGVLSVEQRYASMMLCEVQFQIDSPTLMAKQRSQSDMWSVGTVFHSPRSLLPFVPLLSLSLLLRPGQARPPSRIGSVCQQTGPARASRRLALRSHRLLDVSSTSSMSWRWPTRYANTLALQVWRKARSSSASFGHNGWPRLLEGSRHPSQPFPRRMCSAHMKWSFSKH